MQRELRRPLRAVFVVLATCCATIFVLSRSAALEPVAPSESAESPAPDAEAPAAEGNESEASPAPEGETATPSAEAEGASEAAPNDGETNQDTKPHAVPEPIALDGVQVGKTKHSELHKAWTRPTRVARIAGGVREIYRRDDWGEVRVTIVDDVVSSLAVHVEKPELLAAVAKRLSVDHIEPVDVYDERSELLGVAYPECGVLLGYVPRSRPPRVFQIIIEPTDAEAFLDRAEARSATRYSDCLADVRQALVLAPNSGRAYRLQSKVALAGGELDAALKHIQKAIELAPEEREYRLMLARVLAASGDCEQAINRLREVLGEPNVAEVVAAGAHCQWGDYLTRSGKRDFAEATKHHQQAIKLAEPLVNHERFAVRRAAKEVLLDAHLGVAHDVGWGRWQQKVAVTGKWIERAAALADDLQSHERGGPDVRLRVYLGALAALAGISEPPDASKWIGGVQKLGKRMYDEAIDPTYRAQLAWQVARALSNGVEIEIARHKPQQALAIGKQALALFDDSLKVSERSPTYAYERGRLCARLGSAYAIDLKDHAGALEWFKIATPLLEQPVPSAAVDAGVHGETFVSMAVTYWDQEDRPEALRLTSQGLKLMEQAVADGVLESSSLAVPYGNLASMHESMGEFEQAQKYSEMASRYESTPGNK